MTNSPGVPRTAAGQALCSEGGDYQGDICARIAVIEAEAAEALLDDLLTGTVKAIEDKIEHLPVGFSHVEAVIAVRSVLPEADR